MPRIAENVAWVLSDTAARTGAPACLISRVPDQQPFLLEGSAVVLWTAWHDGLGLEESIGEAAELYGLDTDVIAPDVRALHDRLVRDGVLVPDGEHPAVSSDD